MTASPDFALCDAVLRDHPYPLVFATVSGAHLYGFPSDDSDYDLRGAHLLPVRELVTLHEPRETIESECLVSGVEIDLVTHDLRKFVGLMLKRNGYVLEQLLSPLVVHSTDVHRQLVALAPQCLTKHHAHHYLGFAETQWGLFAKETPPRVKPLLYVYRVLLTGIHLMRTGVVEANIRRLNDEYHLSYIDDLIARKTGGVEKQTLHDPDRSFHEREYRRLRARLETEGSATTLPEAPSCRDDLNALLVRVRLDAHDRGFFE